MPNWCQNEVTIYSDDEEEMQKFIDLVGEDFDFNKIIPMPEELKGTRSPSVIVSQEEYDKQGEEEDSRCLTQELSDQYRTRYGYDNWYDWQCANWGCKWGSCRTEYDGDDTWTFETPWCPPREIFDKLNDMFPKVSISWFYREDGMQIAGWL